MRKAQCDVDLLALDLGAITDAVDFKHTAKALADTLGHIGDQLSRKPMQSPNLTLLALALDSNDIAFNFYIDPRRNSRFELSFRSFQTNFLGFDGHLDSTWDRYGQLSNTRHCTPRLKLPYRTDEFSPYSCLLGLPIHQYPSRRRENVDSQSFSNWRHGLRANVDPATRPANAFDAHDHGPIFPVELELDHKLLPRALGSLYLF